MTNKEAVIWLTSISADICKAEHRDLWQYEQALSEIKEMLETSQPEPQWIPCSKTIDIPDHEVLCCDRHGEELIGWLSYIDDQWLCESDGEMMYDPIAWREKTEPYREEDEADDSN